ncbi:MAG: glycosyl hydrolase family 32 [Inquilinus sp.]|nr:glycosyl hydrolase family 32 [Inquilinus sp.]
MYRPPDHFLWDFWTIRAGTETHLFYLRAPRDLPDPEMRHARARVGHAVSRDLREWQDLGLALEPGPSGAWDDRAIWTGSVEPVPAAEGGGYAMLYTGCCHREDGKVQRIGLARSDDLTIWRKHPANPLIEADRRWYLGPNPLHHGETAWRDPCLVRDPAGGGWLAYITAQAREAEPRGSGAIALARSADLVTWRIGPPVACPGWAFQMEIPQLWRHGNRYFLIFNATGEWIAPQAPVAARHGAFYLISDRPDGGFAFGGVLLAGTGGEYGLKLVVDADGQPMALAWLGYQPYGSFAGALSDPLPVRIEPDGRIRVG